MIKRAYSGIIVGVERFLQNIGEEMKKKKSNRNVAASAVARSKEQLRDSLEWSSIIFIVFILGFLFGKFDGSFFGVLLFAVGLLYFTLRDYLG